MYASVLVLFLLDLRICISIFFVSSAAANLRQSRKKEEGFAPPPVVIPRSLKKKNPLSLSRSDGSGHYPKRSAVRWEECRTYKTHVLHVEGHVYPKPEPKARLDR